MRKHDLAKRQIEIPEDDDVSGLGAELMLMTKKMARDETEECYPGIAVRADGFVAVGACSLGSGDPYFINVRDGEGGPLYRIYHDCVTDDGYDRENGVAIVLQDYRKLLQYARAGDR